MRLVEVVAVGCIRLLRFYTAGFAGYIALTCFYDLSHIPFRSCRHSTIIGLGTESVSVAADSVLLAHDPMRDRVGEAG